MADMVLKMLGSIQTLQQNASSIIFALGRVPDDEDSMDALQEIFGSGFGEDENSDGYGKETNDILECLKRNAVCFDVFESEDENRKSRDQMLQYIKDLTPITNQEGIFQVPLTDTDMLTLQAIADEISDKIEASYEAFALKDVASLLELLANLDVIGNPVVSAHLNKVYEDICEDVDDIFFQSQMKLLSDQEGLEAVEGARKKLDKFTQALIPISFGAPRVEKLTKHIKRVSDNLKAFEENMRKKEMQEAERLEEQKKAEEARRLELIEAENRKRIENEKLEARIRAQEDLVRQLTRSNDAEQKRAAEKELQLSRATNAARNKPKKKGVTSTIMSWFGW